MDQDVLCGRCDSDRVTVIGLFLLSLCQFITIKPTFRPYYSGIFRRGRVCVNHIFKRKKPWIHHQSWALPTYKVLCSCKIRVFSFIFSPPPNCTIFNRVSVVIITTTSSYYLCVVALLYSTFYTCDCARCGWNKGSCKLKSSLSSHCSFVVTY